MARRPDDFTAEPLTLSHDANVATSATATLFAWKAPAARTVRVDRAQLNVPAGFAADAANFWTIAVKNGSTTIASWSTQTGAQGAITANTPVDLINAAADADLVLDPAETLTLVLTETGTATNFPIFSLTIEARKL